MSTRSRTMFWMAALALVVMAAGCGGGGDGGGGGGGGVAAGTFVKDASDISNGPWSGHFSTGWNKWRVQHLYSGTSGTTQVYGSGYITAIGFKADTVVASSFTCTGVTIKMGNTSLDALTTTFTGNVEQGRGSLMTALQDKIVTVPTVTAGEYFTISLDTPFYYNGVDNLVVDFIRNGTCTGSLALRYDSSTLSDQALWSDDPTSATGNLDYAPNMRFHFSGGTNTVVVKDNTGTNSNFIAPGQAGRTQMLILASDITGTGLITGMAIQPDAVTTGGTLSGVTVVMAHLAATTTELSTTFAANSTAASSATTVVSNLTFSVPNAMAQPFWIPFNNGSFSYDGRSNILVDVIVSSSTMTFTVDYVNVANIRTVTTSDPAAATGTQRLRSLQPTFRFKGGSLDAGINANSASGQVFDGTPDGAQIQSLYYPAEIGTGGTIASISLRLQNDSVAATHSGYTVKIGHTAKSQLSGADTYASNMDENRTAFSGSFSIPAGKKAGDWITIPLGASFAYNPGKNLAVLFSTNGGAGSSNTVTWMSSVTQFPARVVGSEAGANTVPTWTDDGILEIRLNLQ